MVPARRGQHFDLSCLIGVSIFSSVYNLEEVSKDLFTDAETVSSLDDDREGVNRSQAGFFRDATKYGLGKGDIIDPSDSWATREIKTTERRSETETTNLTLLENLLKEIDSVTLQIDGEEAVNLEERRVTARQLIQDIYEAAKKYVRSIHEVERAARTKALDTRDYQEVVEDSDRCRRIMHDSLISKINIAKRYMATQFSGISDLQGFLPGWVNVSDRDSITNWAIGLVEELDDREKIEKLHQ